MLLRTIGYKIIRHDSSVEFQLGPMTPFRPIIYLRFEWDPVRKEFKPVTGEIKIDPNIISFRGPQVLSTILRRTQVLVHPPVRGYANFTPAAVLCVLRDLEAVEHIYDPRVAVNVPRQAIHADVLKSWKIIGTSLIVTAPTEERAQNAALLELAARGDADGLLNWLTGGRQVEQIETPEPDLTPAQELIAPFEVP